MNHMAELRLNRLLQLWGSNSHTHLYYLGDKELFWDKRQDAVIAYRRAGKRNIALGDPLGRPEAVERVIAQFIEHCYKHKQIPVFYQSTSRYVELYASYGLHAVKIGEEARIDLPRFHMQGKQWLKLRNRLNKFERTGYSFEVLAPPYCSDIMNRLQCISDEWLAGRKEKSFSVGSFSPEYVSRFPVAVLVAPDGRYEAFATIAGDQPSRDAANDAVRRQITVDLMRYTSACPHGTMDFLFLSLFRWAKEQGFHTCSLGMAPLANMDHLLFVRLLCKYGSKLYNFRGLYDYKNKFAPDWQDVFLISPPSALPVTIGTLTYIIHSSSSALEDERAI